jgi:hypothetical protein
MLSATICLVSLSGSADSTAQYAKIAARYSDLPTPIAILAQADTGETVTDAKRSLKSPPNVDKPTEVALGFYVLNLSHINQADETFDVTGFLYVTWKDKRLAFDPKEVGDKVVRYTPDQIWEPSLTIFNSQSLQQKGRVQLSVLPDGSVRYLELLNVTVTSSLDLQKFPFDSQTVRIIWEPLSVDVKGMVLKENPIATGYTKDAHVSISEWDTLGIDTQISLKKAEKEDKVYPRYTYAMHIRRHFEFYIFKVVMPLLFITTIAWAAFWIDPVTGFAPQMNVGIFSILTSITFNFSVSNSLPKVPYLTMMDGYIYTCYFSSFASVVATLTVHHWITSNKHNQEPALRMMRRLRYLFPSVFAIVQAIVLTAFALR